MTDISPTLPSTPALAEPETAGPLPEMVVGDAAFASPRVHGVRGTLFIGFSYVMAAGSGLSAILFAISGGRAGANMITGLVWAVLQWRLATEVRRFSRWGWYGAVAELAAAAAAKLFWMFDLRDLAFVFVMLLVVDAFMLRYFWTRRDQFDVSFGG
ncbi:MAG TPA: hypothetical protein VF006_08675 [Longimicrobium sp.]